MIILIFLLFIIGMLLIIIETVTPHGVSAFVGIGLIILSCYIAVRDFGWEAGTLYSVMAFVLASGVAWFMLRHGIQFLRLPPPRRPHGTEPEPQASSSAEPRPGDSARVVQPLRPTGTVEWNGRRLAARSLNPQDEIGVGELVTVRERDSIYLIVERTPG